MQSVKSEMYCACHEVAIILKSGNGKTCPACGLPRVWWFDMFKGTTNFVALMKNEPFVLDEPDPIKEPGVVYFATGETQEKAFQSLRAQHCVHADELPSSAKPAFLVGKFLSRLLAWFSAIRR